MQAGFHRALGAPNNSGDLRDRQVFKEMQHEDFAVHEANFAERLMNRCGIFGGKRQGFRRFLGFLKVLKLNLLGALS